MKLFDAPKAYATFRLKRCGSTMTGGTTQSPAPWFGCYLIVFDRKPFARTLMKWLGPVGLAGYFAAIAIAATLEFPGVEWWLNLWTPIVNTFRQYIPLFDNFAITQLGNHVALIHHLLAVGWIINTAIFVFLSRTVWHLPREDWIRFVDLVPAHYRARGLIGGLVFLFCSLYWLMFGFGLAFLQYPRALIIMWAFFWCLTMGALAVQISLQALKADKALRPPQSNLL